MHSDKLVIADDILMAVRRVQQMDRHRLMEELEAKEADLIEHLLEELTMIHHKLVAAIGPSKQQRQLDRRIESLLLVIILAIQSANARLWRDIDAADGFEDGPPPKRPPDGGAKRGEVDG